MAQYRHIFATCVALSASSAATAQTVQISDGIASVEFTINGETLTISRNQDTTARLTGAFVKTSRPCPPNCILPMSLGNGIFSIGEREVIDFLVNTVAGGTGLLIDTRRTADFNKGSVPGAVNVPTATLSPENTFQTDILMALGATQNDGQLEFSRARPLVLFAEGNWDPQVANAVAHLINAGYPPTQIIVYRGGLQDWLHLGLTVTGP